MYTFMRMMLPKVEMSNTLLDSNSFERPSTGLIYQKLLNSATQTPSTDAQTKI